MDYETSKEKVVIGKQSMRIGEIWYERKKEKLLSITG